MPSWLQNAIPNKREWKNYFIKFYFKNSNRSNILKFSFPLKFLATLGAASFHVPEFITEIERIKQNAKNAKYLINCIIIWLTDFACCDWSIPGP